MRNVWTISIASAVGMVAVGMAVTQAAPQQSAAGTTRPVTTARGPRMSDGKPDFSGTWQAMTHAYWDIQDPAAKQGPILPLGAAFSVPAGRGIVEGNEIPYKPEALTQKQQNAKNWLTEDPEVKCYLPGTPRAIYMPYPFQIAQS